MKLTRKIKKVQEELTAKVVGEYRHEVEVSVREELGPFGIKVIVACNPKAHPGTGMKKVLMEFHFVKIEYPSGKRVTMTLCLHEQ